MKSEVQVITPERARIMLENKNEHNRKLRPAGVARFVKLINDREFKLTHQGIAFDTDGKLLDGQHRLEAIARAGIPVEMVVSTNVAGDLFGAIDIGQRKRPHEVMGEEPRLVQSCNFMHLITFGERNPEKYELLPFMEIFRSVSAELEEFCPAQVRKRSSSPIRSAALICMKDRDRKTAKESFRRVVLQDYREMRVSELAFSKWMVDRTINTSTCISAFLRALIAFDSRGFPSVTIREPERHRKNAQVRILNIVREVSE